MCSSKQPKSYQHAKCYDQDNRRDKHASAILPSCRGLGLKLVGCQPFVHGEAICGIKLGSANPRRQQKLPHNQSMARGNIKVGDEVAIMATAIKRVTEDRLSVSILSYNFPHSIVDRATCLVKGQQIELTEDVARSDGDKVTVTLGTMVTVGLDKVRLVQSNVPPKRKRALIDSPD